MGRPYKEIAKECGVSILYVNKLRYRKMKDIEERKRDIANDYINKIEIILRNITPEKIGAASLSQLVVALGVLQDKYNVLTNGVTDIIQVKYQTKEDMIKFLTTDKPDKDSILDTSSVENKEIKDKLINIISKDNGVEH